MEFIKTSIDLFGVQIMEPVTVATDLLVSAVSLYAFFKLNAAKSSLRSVQLLKYYFLALAISTTYGGIMGHALQNIFSFGWKVPGWLIGMASVALIERAAILHAKPMLRLGVGKFFALLNIIELIALTIVVLITLNFFFVEAHAAYGLLVIVFSFELYIYVKNKNEASRLLLVAVGISALAALVHLTEFTIDEWFNHLDLSHVLMALADYVIYLSAIKMKETHV